MSKPQLRRLRKRISRAAKRRAKARRTPNYRRPLVFELLEDRRVLAPFTVTSTADVIDPMDGVLTLREAVIAANAAAGPDTIDLSMMGAGGTYTFSPLLGAAGEDAAMTGDLDITDSLTIMGAGAASTIVDGAGLDRVFHIPFQGLQPPDKLTVNFQDVTITGGKATDGGNGIFVASGGGILNEESGSTISLTDSMVTNNTALGPDLVSFSPDAQGGGIADFSGNWIISNTEIVNNYALADFNGVARGGGIYMNGNTGTSLVDGITIANNEAIGGADLIGDGGGAAQGGGIYSTGTTWTMVGSTTVNANKAMGGASLPGRFAAGGDASGGGIYSESSVWTLTLSPGSTISRNDAIAGSGDAGGDAFGGGIFAGGDTWTVENITISNNTATGGDSGDPAVSGSGGIAQGGGLYNTQFSSFFATFTTIAKNDATGGSGLVAGVGEAGGVFADFSTVSLGSTIVAGNTAGTLNPDVSGNFVSTGYNLIGIVGTATGFALPDLIGTDATPVVPLLGPLQNNGGPTETHELLVGSPAIDAGNPSPFPAFDQRGVTRPQPVAGAPDIGAYEAMASMGGAMIGIEKLTNGMDADTGPGPLIGVGGTANFTYVVTNPGSVALSNVVVTDDQGVTVTFLGGDANMDMMLDTDESWTYTGSTTVTPGQYTNTGTVTALDPASNPVMDSDDSNHFGVQLGITIEKETDGVDADTGPGPEILVGGTATFTYTITNTGNVGLENVSVSDSVPGLSPVLLTNGNGDAILDPLEFWTYEATTTVTPGQYMNTGTVLADDATDTVPGQIMASDDSHHFGADPQIEIEKLVSVDGGATFVDGDFPPFPNAFFTGPAPVFKYEVTLGTGTGAVPLSNVTVTDSVLGAIAGPSSGDDGDLILEAGETWIYLATGTWAARQQTNTGSADGDFTDSQGNTEDAPSATDDATYFGAVVEIDIDKLTNGVDAAVVSPGDPVTFTYAVTNPGNVPLSNVQVVDDNGTPLNLGDDFNPDPVLEVTMTYNVGDLNFDDKLDTNETWHYVYNTTAQDLGVSIDFETDDQGVPLAAGTVIDDEYEDFGLTVSGSPTIFDSSYPALDGAGLVSLLNFNETTGTTAADTSGQGNVNGGNLQGVIGGLPVWTGGTLDFDGVDDRVTLTNSNDINTFDVAQRSIYVRFKADNAAGGKQVLYEEGSTSRGLNIYIDSGQLYVGGWNIPGGAESAWTGTYLNTAITSGVWYEVVLVLDGGLTVGPNALKGYLDGNLFGSGSGSQVWAHSGGIGIGATNDMTMFHDIGPSAANSHFFDGEVDEVRISNPGNFDLGTPNEDFGGPGVGAGGAAGAAGENRDEQENVLFLDAGGTITFDFADPVRVNNIGLLDIDNPGATIELYDSSAMLIGGPISIPALGDNSYQVVVLNAPGVAQMKVIVPGEKFAVTSLDYDLTYMNLGTASGQFNPTAMASDDSSYSNPLVASIDIEKSTNGQDADSPTGPLLAVGSNAVFDYVVSNTGNVPLGNVVVSDDNGTPGTGDDFNPTPVLSGAFNVGDLNMDGLLDLDETWEYAASRIVTAGQYSNNGSVTADDSTGTITTPSTDSDLSHHFGVLPEVDLEKFTRVDVNPIDIQKLVRVESPSVDGDVCDILGKPIALTFQYLPGSTVDTDQDPDKAEIVFDGGVDGDGVSYVVVTDEDDPNKALVGDGKIFFSSNVAFGEYFEANEDVDSFGSTTYIHFFDDAWGGLLQTVEYHTSCSQPIQLGDVIGNATLAGYAGEDGSAEVADLGPGVNDDDADLPTGPEAAVGDTVVFTYVVTNPISGTQISNVQVTDEVLAPVPESPFSPDAVLDGAFNVGDTDMDNQLDFGEQWLYVSNTVVTEATPAGQHVDKATVVGNGGELFDLDPAHFTVVAVPPIQGDVCDELGNPIALTFEYAPGTTVQTAQDSGKAEIVFDSGAFDDDGISFVIATDKEDASDALAGEGKRFFEGNVGFNTTFVADEDLDSFGSTTFIHFFDDATGGLLQSIEYHTSCSQPIQLGDVIGNATLVAYAGESGSAALPPPPVTPPPVDLGSGIIFQTDDAFNPGNIGEDADSPTGPIAQFGDKVTYTYRVSNPGLVALEIEDLVDDNETPGETSDDFTPAPVLVSGFNFGDSNTNNLVDPGEVWHFQVMEIATEFGQHTNNADVVAVFEQLNLSTTDNDASNHIVNPLAIEKYVFAPPAPTGPDQCEVNGDVTSLTFTYLPSLEIITNQKPGQVEFVGVPQLDDDDEAFFVTNKGFSGTVAIGGSFVIDDPGGDLVIEIFDFQGGDLLQKISKYHLSCSQPITLGDVLGSATLTQYAGENGSESISVGLGDPADTPAGPVVLEGDEVVFNYEVTNLGNVALTNVQVTDSQLGAVTDIVDNGNGDNLLDPGETWILTTSYVANVPGQRMNLGTVTANSVDDPAGDQLSQSDPAYHFVESIKFFVVDKDDDATYRYTESGKGIDNFDLQNDNSDARGATALADASKLWVLDKDKNQNVYVYDGDGDVIGAWQAKTTLAENDKLPDKVEGIATDGTDIWIVEKDKHQVYFYSGGVSLVTGPHNASSKFSLHRDNDHARGITTDGFSIWVVDDDGSNNRVFKYTVGGTHLGSWSIDPANDKPRGITIDPTGGTSIWIVDQDADQIFQYDGATGLTSGSKSADSVYNLDEDNDKAEGIADPRPWLLGRQKTTEAAPPLLVTDRAAQDRALAEFAFAFDQITEKPAALGFGKVAQPSYNGRLNIVADVLEIPAIDTAYGVHTKGKEALQADEEFEFFTTEDDDRLDAVFYEFGEAEEDLLAETINFEK